MQPQIFLSYSWTNKDIADTIDNDWKTVGINLIRDIRDLEFKQNLKNFMKQVNDSDYVLLLISKGYLESKNCMYEALKMLESASFKKRILPVLIEDIKINSPEIKLSYIQFWENKIDELNEKIRTLKSFAGVSGVLQDLEHYRKIRDNIDKFITEITDILCISWQDAKSSSYKKIFEVIGFDTDDILQKCIQISLLNTTEERDIALDDLTSKFPDNKFILFTKAKLAIDEGKYKKAKQTYERIISLYPEFIEAQFDLAFLYQERLQEHKAARELYEKGLHFKPNDAQAHHNMVLLLNDYYPKEYELAMKHCKRTLELRPGLADAHNTMGILLKRYLNNYGQARKCYERALQLNPNHPKYNYNLANLLAVHFPMEYELAMEYYKHTLQSNPNHIGTHSNLAVLLETHFNDYENARKHHERAIQLQLANGHPENRRNLAASHYNLANLLRKHYPMEYTLAKEHHDKALEIEPNLPRFNSF